MRIGQGVDAHRFREGGTLVIGGVHIPDVPGLAAHSDGDVLLHALCDALLGAAGLGDIGTHFPDTDPAYAGIDSRLLLREVNARVTEAGFALVNADLTLVAQQPRMGPYIPDMIEHIAEDLGVRRSQVGVKATTTEHMGFTGRGEGIAAFAVVLVAET